MPISLPRQRFTAWRVAGIADRVGVHVLWLGEEIIYPRARLPRYNASA